MLRSTLLVLFLVMGPCASALMLPTGPASSPDNEPDNAQAPAGASPGLASVPTGRMQVPEQNATNQTTIPGFGNGTNTHHHGNVGDQGLGAVWASVFHGVPALAIAADLDGDGAPEAIVGTDLGITAITAGGQMQWSRHIGSTVTALFAFDADGADGLEIGYATLWEGQTPRVGVVDGATGDLQWEHVGPRPFLTAAAASEGPGSDVVAVDIDGLHLRLSGASGEPRWAFDVDLLPDDATGGVAPNTLYRNAGHYLAETADLNGDGVTDTISVGNYYLAAGLQNYALIHAVDGATGDRLWITNVGGDPHLITQARVYDIEALDTQGDGSYDLAYSFVVVRVHTILPTGVYTVEQGWRVTKGDSTTIGVPIGGHTFVTPEVQVISYPDLDHTDVDGDGRHELAALRNIALVNPLLGGLPLTYERYALPLGSTGSPTLLAVSDVTLYAGEDARIVAFDRDGDGGRDHSIAWTLDGNVTWMVITAEGEILGPLSIGKLPVRAVAGLGGQVAVATRSAVELRPGSDLGAPTQVVPLRGAPLQVRLADDDGDGVDDLFVLGSDGAVHVVDGVTGIAGRLIEVGEATTGLQVADLGRGPAPDLVVARLTEWDRQRVADGFTPYEPLHVLGIDGDTGKVLFERVPDVFADRLLEEPLWFDGDGDGVRDLLHSYDWTSQESIAMDGSTGRDLWAEEFQTDDSTFGASYWRHGNTARLDGGPGDDLLLAGNGGLLLVDGDRGRTLGWYPLAGNGTQAYNRGAVTCMGGADDDGDGIQDVYVIHSGSAGDLARRVVNDTWEVLDWVPDEVEVMRCEILPASRAGGAAEDLLVTMVWVEDGGSGDVKSLIGRYDPSRQDWAWREVQTRPAVEAEAYTAFGVSAQLAQGRVLLAWQDHAYALAWSNGTLIGEFTVNGPFVVAGTLIDLDQKGPSEAVVLAADGILWALAEDRGAVASALAKKANDANKPNNFGAGSSFEAAPLPDEKKKDKSIPVGPAVSALAVLGALAWRRRRDNR